MPQEPFQLSVGSAQGLNEAFMVEVMKHESFQGK